MRVLHVNAKTVDFGLNTGEIHGNILHVGLAVGTILHALCKIHTKVIDLILYALKGELHLACDRVPIEDKPIIRVGFPASPEVVHSRKFWRSRNFSLFFPSKSRLKQTQALKSSL
jgi:hypothetical protein